MDLYDILKLFFDLSNKELIEIILAFIITISIGIFFYLYKVKHHDTNNRIINLQDYNKLIDELKSIQSEVKDLKNSLEKVNEYINNKCHDIKSNVNEINEDMENLKINIGLLSERISYLLQILIMKLNK